MEKTEVKPDLTEVEKDTFLGRVKKLAPYARRLERIGINGKDLPHALKYLKQKRIKHVIDVRHNTFYKTGQGFNPENFKKVLRENGISYMYLQKLGNPFHKEFQKQLKEALKKKDARKVRAIDLAAREKYLEHVRTEQEETMEALFKLTAHTRAHKKEKFCFLCYCDTEDPLKCHTYWLIEALVNMRREELYLEPNFHLYREAL